MKSQAKVIPERRKERRGGRFSLAQQRARSSVAAYAVVHTLENHKLYKYTGRTILMENKVHYLTISSKAKLISHTKELSKPRCCVSTK